MTDEPERTHHHYVPRFYLKQWCTDGLLWASWRGHHAKLRDAQRSTKGVAKQQYLYTLKQESTYFKGTRGDAIEDALSKLENLAAPIHQKLLVSPPSSLTSGEREIWAAFLRGFDVRGAEFLQSVDEEMVPQRVQAIADEMRQSAIRAGEDPSRIDYLLTRFDSLTVGQNMARQALLQHIVNPDGLKRLLNLQWACLRIQQGHELITSDKPVYRLPASLDEPFVLLGMPLSPRDLFVATRAGEDLTEAVKLLLLGANFALLAQRPSMVFSRSRLADGPNIHLRSAVGEALAATSTRPVRRM